MRSNSGNDKSRNNMRDPTMRDRELGRGGTATTGKKAKAGSARQVENSRDAVVIRDAIERETQDELASTRGPSERRLGITHPLAGANDPP